MREQRRASIQLTGATHRYHFSLLHNPCPVRLDELTSVLDSACRKVLEAALDTAAKGSTTIAETPIKFKVGGSHDLYI